MLTRKACTHTYTDTTLANNLIPLYTLPHTHPNPNPHPQIPTRTYTHTHRSLLAPISDILPPITTKTFISDWSWSAIRFHCEEEKSRIISFPTDLFLDWTQIGFNWITRLIFPVTDCCLFRLKFRWKILIQPSDCLVKKYFWGRCYKTVGGNSKNLGFPSKPAFKLI